jgi:hypothetical protein
MTMYRSASLVSALVLVSLLLLAGCGGGGTGVAPVTPPSAASTQAVYILDFVHHTVSTAVQAQYVERNPTTGTGNTPDLALTLAFPALRTGNPGREQITATVKNDTTGTVGANDQGTVTGIDLCFVSTVFWDGTGLSASVVPGGGYGGYTSLNPADGTPIFTIPGSLAAGATTNPGAPVSISVPRSATTATVTVVVRTDTVFMNLPDLTHWYLTTLAGHSGVMGYRDGPAAQALFNTPQFLLYREDVGDLLVSDTNNGCIRRLYQGQVTTFVPPGAGLVSPEGLGRDSAGNVYISDYNTGEVLAVPPSGGTPTVIATGFVHPEGLAVSGNYIYVCDDGASKVYLLQYNGGGNFNPAKWGKKDITNGAPFSDPMGVGLDAMGNVYLAAEGDNRIWVLPQGTTTWAVIAGDGGSGEHNGAAQDCTFQNLVGIAVDQSGIVYVADGNISLRRLVHLGGPLALTDETTWSVTTLVPSAAAPVDGFTGTGTVNGLLGVSCARDGTLYLAGDNDVRRLDRTRN